MTDQSNANRPTAAIVIPSYGRTDLLLRTLDSLAEAVWPAGFTCIRVVENGPRAGVEAILEPYAPRIPVVYQNEPTLGLSAARNAGLASCSEDIVIFFDNDVRVERNSLLAYRHAFDKYGLEAFYSGPILPDYVVPPPDWLRPFLPSSAAGFDLGKDDCCLDKPLFIGPSMAFPRHLLEAACGFDRIGANGDRGGMGEETRLQRRLLASGYQGRYVGGARVWHYVPPENCSPQWIIGRAYRYGITKSLEARARGRKAGIRRWMIRRAVTLECQYWLGRMRGKSLEQRFTVAWDRGFHRGVIAGCYDGKNDGERLPVMKAGDSKILPPE